MDWMTAKNTLAMKNKSFLSFLGLNPNRIKIHERIIAALLVLFNKEVFVFVGNRKRCRCYYGTKDTHVKHQFMDSCIGTAYSCIDALK